MKENFKVTDKETGKEYWISRSIAVVAFIVAKKNEDYYFLLERRGEGCPDNVGKLSAPCGYLSWGETRKQAVQREVFEEIGLDISNCRIEEWKTIDDPEKDARENVVTRYIVPVDFDSIQKILLSDGLDLDTESRGGEKDEVSEVLFLPASEIESEDFAFGHKEIIKELVTYLSSE